MMTLTDKSIRTADETTRQIMTAALLLSISISFIRHTYIFWTYFCRFVTSSEMLKMQKVHQFAWTDIYFYTLK